MYREPNGERPTVERSETAYPPKGGLPDMGLRPTTGAEEARGAC